MLTAQVIFLCVHVFSGVVLGCIALPLLVSGDHSARQFAWVPAAIVLSALALHPRVLSAVVTWVARRQDPTVVVPAIDGNHVCAAVAWMTGTWLLYGTAMAALIIPLGGTTPATLVLSVSGFAIAWVIGFLVLVAPAGAGAQRDGARRLPCGGPQQRRGHDRRRGLARPDDIRRRCPCGRCCSPPQALHTEY